MLELVTLQIGKSVENINEKSINQWLSNLLVNWM